MRRLSIPCLFLYAHWNLVGILRADRAITIDEPIDGMNRLNLICRLFLFESNQNSSSV